MSRTRSLSACLLLTTALISPAALAQPKYPATVDVFAGGGSQGFEGGLEVMAPLVEGESSLLFGLASGVVGDETGTGSIGLGYRHRLLPGWILGGFGALDYQRGQSDTGTFQGVLGLEAMSELFDLRVNGYLPENDETTLADVTGTVPPPPPVTIGDIAIVGHEIGLITGTTAGTAASFQSFERPLRGFDAEIGARLPIPGQELRLFFGGFHFEAPGYEDISGPKARAEWRLNDIDLIGGNSRLTIDAQIRDDDVRGTDASAGIRIRVPFGGVPSNRRGDRLAALDQRMLDPIGRERHIVTGTREESQAGTPGTVAIEAVKAVVTGYEIASIWFADGAGGGDGTMGSETTLGAAVTGAGAGGLIVALGGSGNLAGNVTLANDQILLGGASTLQIMGLETGTMATYGPGGARPTIVDDGTAATAVVQLADGNLLAGIDTTSGGINILGNGVDDLIVRDVATGGLGSGMAIIGGTNIDVTDFDYLRSAPSSGGFGLRLVDVTTASLDGLDIENAGFGLFIANSQMIDVANLLATNTGAGFAVTLSNDVDLSNITALYNLIPGAGTRVGGVINESTDVQLDGLNASGMTTGFEIN